MKIRYLLTGLLVVAFLVNGCASPNPPQPPTPGTGDFTMEVKVDKSVYKANEKLVVTSKATKQCYLTLYDISTVGAVTQIFPNRFAKDNLIQAGQAYSIPTASDTFDFLVTGPAGVERIRSVCTMQNVNFFQQQSSSDAFPRVTVPTAEFDSSLSTQLGTIPAGQWTEASVTFEVQQ